jgi:hypothetical protein
MTINDEVLMPPSDPYGRLGCTLRRTPSYALHVRVEPHLDTATLPDTVRALAAQLVLVPRFVVLETGELLGCAESHALAVGHVAALVRRAGIQLRVVLPVNSGLPDRLLQVGILPADGVFHNVDAAVNGRV